MDRPITTLFMLMSVDGKISTGSTDNMDVDKDFPGIPGVAEGLHQYYEIEQTTDLWSFNTGRVQAKMGVNEKEMPSKTPVSFVILDNHHLTEHDSLDEESIEIVRWGVEATEEYLESSTGLIVQYLCEKGLVADCTDDGYPHSVVELKLFYLDNDENLHRIDLNPIRESWKNLEYKEILKQINIKCIDFFKE